MQYETDMTRCLLSVPAASLGWVVALSQAGRTRGGMVSSFIQGRTANGGRLLKMIVLLAKEHYYKFRGWTLPPDAS